MEAENERFRMVLSALKNFDFEIFVKIRGFPNSGFSLLSLSLSLSLYHHHLQLLILSSFSFGDATI